MNKIYKISIFLNFLLISLFSGFSSFADGSKDLYPSGKQGLRARLYTGQATSNTSRPAYPFPNNGVHYVYAEVGETITLASSAQGSGDARISLYAPNGTAVINSSTAGNISNRSAELDGPRLPGVTTGVGYTPVYYEVPSGEEGVYRVEFISRSASGDPASGSITANSNWTQANGAEIMAWDVSVVNAAKNAFIPGRVYANVLNLSNGYSITNNNGFYGLVYALTKDGYTYRVDNNGNNGLFFTFYVNNNGFVDRDTQEPTYRSINSTAANDLQGRVHNPNSADTERHITHKMFYTLPADDLPTEASGAVPGGITWLKNEVIVPDVSEVGLIGVDGSVGQVSNKGGYVQFEAGAQGQYSITIESTKTPAEFRTRILRGSSIAGENSIFWDGKAGSQADPTQPGDPLPAGNVPARVIVELQGAEVHFPFFDMEYNTKGIVIELLNHEDLDAPALSDIVYWDDRDIPNATNGTNAPGGRYSDPKNNSHLPPTNSIGISSNANGHIWGLGATGTGNQFGDEKSIDTWTFIKGEADTLDTEVAIKIADLEIVSVASDKSTLKVGEEIIYTVVAKNGGPSDVEKAPFAFNLPESFEITSVSSTSESDCGAEHDGAVTTEGNTYNANLDLPNGCVITYEFTVSLAATAPFGSMEADATIMRPNDVTDPDATNPDRAVPPRDPYYEIEHNGFSGVSNNIKKVTVTVTPEADLSIQKTVSDSSPHIGSTVTFTMTVTNSGPHEATQIRITDAVDQLKFTIGTIHDGGTNAAEGITWTIPTLASGASTTVSFEATVNEVGTVTNTATVTATEDDPDPSDNTSTVSITVCAAPEGQVPLSGTILNNK